jgi:YVTN family beta-propeller protein
MRSGFRANFSPRVLARFLLVFGGLTFVTATPKPIPRQAPAPPVPPLDFEVYRTRIEPVFLKQRESGVRCYDCHSVLNTRLRLQPLSAGNPSWTEEQSRKNFEVVLQLTTPGDPLKSRLLLHPLASDAGGDPVHTGGKFWKTQSDPEWQMLAEWVRHTTAASPPTPTGSNSQSKDGLDFEYFKSAIQPIFLKERPGHARCYGCHTASNRVFHLAELSPGLTDWTEEQSRQNLQSASQLVVPGKPQSSRLLVHPLAPEAGGDAFHSGGRQFASQEDPDWIVLAQWVRSASAPGSVAAPSVSAARIYVTNSAGNTVDVIDSSTNQVVQVIRGIELPHGVVFSPDGKRVYISNESESIVDVVDRESAKILKKVVLSGHPNNLTITKDGGRVLVGIREDPGSVDVIDTKSLEPTKSISVDGSVHNIFVTPDGKYAVSGSIENKAATVIDLSTEKAAWEIKFDRGVRPMAFEANPDGSTRRIFVQLSGLNGFAVVDFASRKEAARIVLPEQPGGFGTAEERLGTPSHGIGVAPDGKSLWVNSTVANAVFKYSLPDLQLLGYCPLPVQQPPNRSVLGAVPEWITFTPDSLRVYDSNSGARSVSVIDAKTLKLVDVVNVGEVPKRINTLTVPREK